MIRACANAETRRPCDCRSTRTLFRAQRSTRTFRQSPLSEKVQIIQLITDLVEKLDDAAAAVIENIGPARGEPTPDYLMSVQDASTDLWSGALA